MDAAEASEDVDPVFQRARQAQETTLRAAGKKFVAKLGQKDYLGKRGLDGHLLCDKWSVELKWGERAGRAYASDAAPRGPQALPRGSTAMSEEDEYSSSGEGRALADAAGVSVWAVTRRKGPKRPVESQPPVDAEPEKGKRACGAKNRLQQTLGCEIVYRCQLCMHPMRAARQVLSLATHRNGKCVLLLVTKARVVAASVVHRALVLWLRWMLDSKLCSRPTHKLLCMSLARWTSLLNMAIAIVERCTRTANPVDTMIEGPEQTGWPAVARV